MIISIAFNTSIITIIGIVIITSPSKCTSQEDENFQSDNDIFHEPDSKIFPHGFTFRNLPRLSKRSSSDDSKQDDSNTANPSHKVESENEIPSLVCYYGGILVDRQQIFAILNASPMVTHSLTTYQPPMRTRQLRPHQVEPPRKGQPNYPRNHKFRNPKFQQADNYGDEMGYYDGANQNLPEKEANYWLVPPFLIGASSIIFAYVVIHCLYTYCNCNGNPNRKSNTTGGGGGRSNHGYQKPTSVRRVHLVNAPMHHHKSVDGGPGHGIKIRSIPSHQQQQPPGFPSIILSDNNDFDEKVDRVKVHCPADGAGLRPEVTMTGYSFDGLSGNNIQHSQRRFSHIVPIYGADEGNDKMFGQTQIIETRPFLVFESEEDEEEEDEEEEERKTKRAKRTDSQRRKSALLQIPQAIGRRLSQTRFSFSSGGSTPHIRENQNNRQPRASICFLPVARTVSDPSCSMLQVVVPPGAGGGSTGCVDQTMSQASSLTADNSDQKNKSSSTVNNYQPQQQQEDVTQTPSVTGNGHAVTTATTSLPLVMISSPSEASLNASNDQDALLPSINSTTNIEDAPVAS